MKKNWGRCPNKVSSTSGVQQDIRDIQTYRQNTRIRFINLLAVSGILFFLSLLIHNLLTKKIVALFIILPVFISILIINIIILRITRNTLFCGLIMLVLFIVSIPLNILTTEAMGNLVQLIYLFPLVNFYLMGQKHGLIWAIAFEVFYLTIGVLMYLKIIPNSFSLDYIVFSNITLFLITATTYIYQKRSDTTEKKLIDQIYTDALTGMPNRNQLLLDIESAHSPTLFLIDIDGFKDINDTFGYANGDEVLKSLGIRLRQIKPGEAAGVYRLSADEFAVLFDLRRDSIPWDSYKRLADLFISLVNQESFSFENYQIHIQITIGISAAHCVGKENILSRADIALKMAKKDRKPYLFFKQIEKEYQQNLENFKWVGIIANAIENNRVFPFFQPIIDNENNTVSKYESLCRMTTTEGKFIAPNIFLNIAKKIRVYPQLTRTMVKQSMEKFRYLPHEFSINLSIEDILDEDTAHFIFTAIEVYPEISSRVVFELLESEGIENYQQISQFISEVKKQGCKIAIDDFGSGYSNFEHILRLNVDYLKIDASLIRNIDHSENSRIIVEHIVNFARQLNIKTIAEFVHSREVYEIVKKLHIDYSQGFYLGEPKSSLD